MMMTIYLLKDGQVLDDALFFSHLGICLGLEQWSVNELVTCAFMTMSITKG